MDKQPCLLQKAFAILGEVQGKEISLNRREILAIELAAIILEEASRIETRREKKQHEELARMMSDSQGKVFTTCMTDQCFRSEKSDRVASQMVYLLQRFGVPRYLDLPKRLSLKGFEIFGKALAPLLVPLATWMLRKQTQSVILPGEKPSLLKHLRARKIERVRLNINHLGEAILGEEEAVHRLSVYLHDLEQEEIEYVSIKISTIYSQINLLGWDATLKAVAERLRQLYRAAKNHYFQHADGTRRQKFVNLDMEEYRDLHLTVELFMQLLSEPEFHDFSAGIVLQAYLPDSHMYQKVLTQWAIQRVQNGGAPIKIRIVKGANLAMEQFEASVKGWKQAPYRDKIAVDANYKRMVTYGASPDHAKAVHLGIGSHNLFDIAYALLLRAEHGVEGELSFEMLEGMADPIRRVVQHLAGDILLYCPVATKKDFQSAVAYLIRRLDENTGPDNFLRHTFGLKPHTPAWEEQVAQFTASCARISSVSLGPRRTQSRYERAELLSMDASFENEPDTDFSLSHNRKWVEEAIEIWKKKTFSSIPLVIDGKEIIEKDPQGVGYDPSNPQRPIHTYSMADGSQVDQALLVAKKMEQQWSLTPLTQRCLLLSQAAQKMREKRGDLIGVMMLNGGKTPFEADAEISEAIDFAEYYLRSAREMENLRGISWRARGTYLVAPPWNFPISIPVGGILGALVMGNCVLFKPAPEAVLSGWILVNILWEAGIDKKILQFINCVDDPVGSQLIRDQRLNGVILTGATSTAHLFMQMRPDLDLSAETGGKNSLIISALSDRDLAIKDLIQSAFGHSGQKCSAASLAILEKEVYDDSRFRQQLKDAVLSLQVGSAWDLSSKVIPLIRQPSPALLRGLTSLEPGEEWLVEPKPDRENPNLWSPGVKWGVKPGSFMHQTELFGPVLGVMRASDLKQAIALANGTPYGLTAGFHGLDQREQQYWLSNIEAGNLYVNRGTTGAIVRRQPFGGTKGSHFGRGAKAGGPNYLMQLGIPTENVLPNEPAPIPNRMRPLCRFIETLSLSAEGSRCWHASTASYAFWSTQWEKGVDPSLVIGQDNLFEYRPYGGICLRIHIQDAPIDVLRVCAAALACNTHIEISWTSTQTSLRIDEELKRVLPTFLFVEESEETFMKRVESGSWKRLRLLTAPSPALQKVAAQSACHIAYAPVFGNGRLELLHYLREVAISFDYHRYGNLGAREGEERSTIF